MGSRTKQEYTQMIKFSANMNDSSRRPHLPPTVHAYEGADLNNCASALPALGHRTTNENVAEGHGGVIMWLIQNLNKSAAQ